MGTPSPDWRGPFLAVLLGLTIQKKHELHFAPWGTASPGRAPFPGVPAQPTSRCSARCFTENFSLTTAPAQFGVLPQWAFRNIHVPPACSASVISDSH